MNPIEEWQDAFGKQVSTTTNEADLAAHYPYSPERLRVFVNGTRQFPEYESVTEYQDTIDGRRLRPQSAGDTVTLATAERYRYVVQYVIEWSAALQTTHELQSGDAVTLAYGDADLTNSADGTPGPNADGWIWYWNSSHPGTSVTLSEYRAGTEVDAETVSLEKGLTTWGRVAGETNWYNVGNTEFIETYTQDGAQKNPTVGKTSVDDDKGPQTANKPVQLSVTAEAGAGSLEAELGSVGVRTLGSVDPIQRQKTHSFTAALGTTGTWVPIHALRVDPDREIINTQLANTYVTKFSGSGDVRVMPIAVAPENALDGTGSQPTDWATPPEHSVANSVIETTSSIDQFPDDTGTVGTSAADPGGYQLGFGSRYSSGLGSKTSISSGPQTQKRQVSARDVCVFLAYSDTTGDITVEVITEQEW
jgi:hypothetical protein